MKNHAVQQRRATFVAALAAISLALALALAPGLANAEDTADAPASTAMPTAEATALPEWAIDDGKDMQSISLTTQAELPAQYDLRNEKLVTPVKFQNPWGSCWAFGGVAAAEVSLLSSLGMSYEETGLDLSERHLTYFALHPVTALEDADQAGEGIHLFGEADDPNAAFDAGGKPLYVTTLFAQGIGPVAESVYPYRGKNAVTTLQYFEEHADEEVQKFLQSQVDTYNAQYPDMNMTIEKLIAAFIASTDGPYKDANSEADVRAIIKDSLRQRAEGMITYSEHDDWSIPATNDQGQSNRLINGGFVLKDGNILPDYWNATKTNNDEGKRAIKQEILNGHGVSIGYYADQSGYFSVSDAEKGTEFAQFVPNGGVAPEGAGLIDVSNISDHAVCIVGWDDNYDKSNFTHALDAQGKPLKDIDGNDLSEEEAEALTTPSSNGAWIVKNSWGSETDAAPDDLGNVVNELAYGIKVDGKCTGYFYLSYEDASITKVESMEFSTNLYHDEGFFTIQHDYMPASSGFYQLVDPDETKRGSLLSSANVFTAEEAIEVKSVSTRTYAPNMRVTYAIYLLDDNAADPDDGTLIRRVSKNYEYAGFHRLDLDQPFTLEKGQRFSVISSTSTLNAGGARQYSISVPMGVSESYAAAMQLQYYDTAIVNAGESFLYSDDEWTDWALYRTMIQYMTATGEIRVYNDDFPLDNFSIKVYATPAQEAPVEPNPVNPDSTSGMPVGQTAKAGSGTTSALYTVTGASTVTYKAVASKAIKEVTVPDTVVINGKTYRVTKIADKAFSDSKATKIIVGENVTKVDKNTFAGAKKVKVIVLGKNVSKVAAKAFAANKALRTLELQTTKLTKKARIKNCLKGSKVKKLVMNFGTTAQNNKYAKKYKKLFAAKKPASGKKVKVL